MWNRIRNFFTGPSRAEKAFIESMQRQLSQMSKDLGQALPLSDLQPVLIPSSILADGGWFGPSHHFPKLPVSLTWAYRRPESSMQYLSADAAARLTADGIDWRTEARKNLDADSARRPWFAKRHPNDESRAASAMLQDELGPSRLLCYDQLSGPFPTGFRFFVPERWTAFVLAPDAPAEVVDQLLGTIQQTHQEADVPMSLEPYDHLLLREALVACGEYTPA